MTKIYGRNKILVVDVKNIYVILHSIWKVRFCSRHRNSAEASLKLISR